MQIDCVTYCGFIGIIGRSNVGKSTLINKILGKKVSITSKRLNTTKNKIIGVHTTLTHQAVYVDTPGINTQNINMIHNNFINKFELIIFVIDGMHKKIHDEQILSKLYNITCPVILAINKIDKIYDKKKLLPRINFFSKQMNFYDILPICAKDGTNINELKNIIYKCLPKSPYLFPQHYITNQSKLILVSEIIREKVMRFLGKEIPYISQIQIKHFNIDCFDNYNIYGIIRVKNNGQKKIVIGHKGNKIKIISMQAKRDMMILLKKCVHLKLWVMLHTS